MYDYIFIYKWEKKIDGIEETPGKFCKLISSGFDWDKAIHK